VAVNKPYGLAMFGDGRRPTVESLLAGLAEHLGVARPADLRPVHRLDRVTTGVLLMAKTPQMHHTLTNLFRQRKVAKQYWAILNGTPLPDQGIIQIPLRESGKYNKSSGETSRFRIVLSPDYNQSAVVDKKTLRGSVSPATTEYRVLAIKGNASLVLVKPHTGVKHQIRAHMGFGIGTPILGDHKYSQIRDLGKPQRVHGDILKRLGVRRSRGRDLPVFLHSKKIFLPGDLASNGGSDESDDDHTNAPVEGRHTKFLAIDCGLPHHFNNAMKRLKIKPRTWVK